MHRISRISVTVDTGNLLLIARLFGLRDPSQDPRDLIDHIKGVGQPWLYDIILDFRRFEADLDSDAMYSLCHKWLDLEPQGNAHKILAIVTADLGLKASLIGIAHALPHRHATFFDTFDEALDGIKAGTATPVPRAGLAFTPVNQALRHI